MEPLGPPGPVVVGNYPHSMIFGPDFFINRISIEIFKLTPGEVLQSADDLGSFLPRLPLEIHQLILQKLDISTLVNSGHTSKGMKRHVCRLPKLRALVDHAPDAMRAIVTLGMGHILTCADLYENLVSPSCDVCERLAFHVYLLACVRLCGACLLSNTRYRPFRPKHALHLYGPCADQIRCLPMLLLPGYARISSFQSINQRKRLIMEAGCGLIDEHEVERLCVRTHGVVQAAGRAMMAKYVRWNKDSRYSCPTNFDSANAASVFFPWLERSTQTSGAPIFCEACHGAGAPLRECIYLAADNHMARCGEIINGAHVKSRYNENA